VSVKFYVNDLIRYFRRSFLENNIEEQRVKHAYFKVDIPFEEWLMIAKPGYTVDYCISTVNLWKDLKPYVK
jgi:hypothetical protein